MAEFPFEFSPVLQPEYEVNPELKVSLRDGSSFKLMRRYIYYVVHMLKTIKYGYKERGIDNKL